MINEIFEYYLSNLNLNLITLPDIIIFARKFIYSNSGLQLFFNLFLENKFTEINEINSTGWERRFIKIELIKNQIISEDNVIKLFINSKWNQYSNIIDGYEELAEYIRFSPEFLKKYGRYLDSKKMSFWQNLDNEFIEKNIHRIDTDELLKRKKLLELGIKI